MNVEKLKQLKKDAGYTNQMISDESGVPLGTVQKIFSGETKAPRFKTLKAIEGVLIYASGYDDEMRLAAAYERPVARPVPAPADNIDTEVQQDSGSETNGASEKDMLKELMTGEIIFAIRSYMEENGISGYMAGLRTPVRFGRADQTGEAIYPDICLVTNREMIRRDGIEGAPKLIIEIMDSETKSMQLGAKPDMYREAGVKEYWMIDISSKNIMAYDFEREAFPSMYGFSGRVPVRSIGGGCEVNFAKLYSKVGFLFDEED